MLTDQDKIGLQELLSLLSSEDLKSLATTVTKNNLVINTESEAVEAIFLHSESSEWLLQRQKITRVVLFQYLHNKRVSCPATADKSSLIKLTLKSWSSNECQIDSEQKTVIEPIANSSVNESQLIAVKFTQWFYSLAPSQMVPEHFWPNSNVRVTFGQNPGSNVAQGAPEAAALFQNLGVQLNPNLSDEGVRGVRNRHGLLIVAACGTVHQQGFCRGLFEQAFGLIQDPSSENRWKIQWTELRLTEANVHKLPAISDSPELLAICNN